MKRKILKVLVIILVFVFAFAGYFYFNKISSKELTIEQKVDKLLKKMSLDEKIGQMLVIYYSSANYDNLLNNTIVNIGPGGFILFKENIKNYDQLTNFISSMQKNSEIPMLISIDQEGGIVQRLGSINENISIIPAMANLGAMQDETLAYEVGKVIGNELNVFGINMNYAPVIDIDSNPNNTVIGNRAFGDNAELVSKMGIATANGLKDSNVIPVYKHFPGHGDTAEDSHYTLPVLNKTKEELYQLELKPFINAINNGAEVIMIGHIAVPKLTGDNTPASLSKIVINDLLKDELGFKGVVITDALNMGALEYDNDEIIIKAINAGVDMLLMPGPSKTTLSIIKSAIANKKITEQQINNSVRKILLLKYNNGLFEKRTLNDKSMLNSQEHQEILNKIKEVE